jgi:hypothetical protein
MFALYETGGHIEQERKRDEMSSKRNVCVVIVYIRAVLVGYADSGRLE